MPYKFITYPKYQFMLLNIYVMKQHSNIHRGEIKLISLNIKEITILFHSRDAFNLNYTRKKTILPLPPHQHYHKWLFVFAKWCISVSFNLHVKTFCMLRCELTLKWKQKVDEKKTRIICTTLILCEFFFFNFYGQLSVEMIIL